MNKTNHIPRPEHPRPDFMRDTFYNLNGTWEFDYDDNEVGVAEEWYRPGKHLAQSIVVPFCYQCEASGIGPTDEIHPVLWYRRTFLVPSEMQGKRILVRFGAVDYKATVYVNGHSIGEHKGGYTPFALDATDYLVEGKNDLCVRVEDRPDPTQLRGKQMWSKGLFECWYTPVSGIWQTVYLEAVEDLRIEYIHVTPDIDKGIAVAEIMLNKKPAEKAKLAARVCMNGEEVREIVATTRNRSARVLLDLNTCDTKEPVVLWSPVSPALYDLEVEVHCGEEMVDRVRTYFGMRKIEVRNGAVFLNNERYYQRMILDQGYWPDTLLTPPSDEAIKEDLDWVLKFGFNAARKHQKIEDPRYYYWADKLGVLVWGELPSPYEYSDVTLENMTSTMLEFISRDFNHPSIVAWVPLNESWGVRQIVGDKRQQAAASMLYYLTKAADGTRLCSGNDGWEQAHTDICGLHDYSGDTDRMRRQLSSRKNAEDNGCWTRICYVDGYEPTGKEAFMMTEYGGIAFENLGLQGQMGGTETWGYNGKVCDEDAFFARYKELTDVIKEVPYNEGYCYTQLTDVMQEINGLLTPDRKPKVSVERVRQINDHGGNIN